MHFELLKKYDRTIKIVFTILLLFIVLDLLFPLPSKKEFSKEIHSKDGTLLTAYLTCDDKWRLRTELDEISPELIKAIVEKEDSWFYWHPGINPIAVVRAFYKNVSAGETQLGASTITMQVARMLEPKKRTYFNKLGEMFRAIQLEIKYSKKEILELYLSLPPEQQIAVETIFLRLVTLGEGTEDTRRRAPWIRAPCEIPAVRGHRPGSRHPDAD